MTPLLPKHLHCFECVLLQVVDCARQLFNLLSEGRLVTVLDEDNECSVICKLQELDRGVFCRAVVEEEQCGVNSEPVLMVQGLDVNFPILTSCKEVDAPLTDGLVMLH